MNFRLDIVNSGDLLARFGMKDVVRRGKGQMQGQVAWIGSPLSLDYASLSGAFKVKLKRRTGKMYATVPVRVLADVAECSAAKSRKVTVRRR